MEMELYKIKQLMMSCAEVGAARVMQAYEPKADMLTQRQAYTFFRERDTKFNGSFTHGKAWVEEMVRRDMLPQSAQAKARIALFTTPRLKCWQQELLVR